VIAVTRRRIFETGQHPAVQPFASIARSFDAHTIAPPLPAAMEGLSLANNPRDMEAT
jgi:hypothetical protein